MAVANDLIVTIYDIDGGSTATKLEQTTLPLQEKVTFLVFRDQDHLDCQDSAGNRLTLERKPAWQIKN